MTASEVAKIAAKANDARIKDTIQSAKLNPSLHKAIADLSKTATIKSTIPQITASPTTKGALAEALANIKPAMMPKITGGTIQSAKLSPPPAASIVVAEPVQLEPIISDREWAAGGIAEQLQSEALGEVVAGTHAREDREAAIELLAVLGLDDATEHLHEIESCLLRGRKPSRLHAALSASVLLRDLADRLFPARDEPWVSRSGRRHEVDHEHVKNRLSAFVDARLRSVLAPKEHQLFQSTLDVVSDWTGRGHHIPADTRQAARAFRHLLEVLATIARAHRVGERHDGC